MKLDDYQLELAAQRAACVYAFRNWKVSEPRRPFCKLLAELRHQFPGISVSRATLYRWDKSTSRYVLTAELLDHRGGDMKGHGASFNEWWRDYLERSPIPPEAVELMIHQADGPLNDDTLRRLACVTAIAHLLDDPPCPTTHAVPALVRILCYSFPELSLSRTSLYRWLARYRDGGLEALVDHRGGDRRSAEWQSTT